MMDVSLYHAFLNGMELVTYFLSFLDTKDQHECFHLLNHQYDEQVLSHQKLLMKNV